jgi:hypothetical protein
MSALSRDRPSGLLQWRPGDRKTIYLCVAVLTACALLMVVFAGVIWSDYAGQTPGHPAEFGDFFAIWSYAEILRDHPATDLYDFATLHAEQVALGMNPAFDKPCPYPPMFLNFLWPLRQLPYNAAYLAWSLGTLGLFVWVVLATCSRLPVCVLGVILAPESTETIFAGQSGFLAAALLTAGVRLAGRRPVLAGILLGLLSYKPQFGLLVPVALVAGGFWLVFAAACATVAALALTASVVFGWGVWQAWLEMLPAYSALFDRFTEFLPLQPTVTANLQMLGAAPGTARAIQALVALIVAVFIWRCFRRLPGPLAAAALLTGTFLATPHAFICDMPMLTAAIALYIQTRVGQAGAFQLPEIAILLVAFLFPALMMVAGFAVPTSTLALALFFGLILRTAARSGGAGVV